MSTNPDVNTPYETKDEAVRLHEYYRRYLDDTMEWRSERDKLEQIYHGYVFEVGEGQEEEAEERTTVVDNRIRPLIRKRTSKLVANKPGGKVFGVSDADQQLVDIFAAMGDYFWEISDGSKEIQAAVLDQQKLGAGYLLLYHDPYADYGMGELKFEHLSYRNVFYDKQASKIEKSPRIIIRKLMDARDFCDEFDKDYSDRQQYLCPDDTVRYQMEGTDRKTIETELPTQFEGGEKEFVLVLETYEKKWVDGFVFRDFRPKGQLVSAVKGKGDDQYASIEAFQESLDEVQLGMLAAGFAQVYDTKVCRIKVTQSVGDVEVLGTPVWLELDEIPVIELRGEDTYNGTPRGEVDYLAENQQFMSKALNLVISNAAMGSLLRYIIDPQASMEMTQDEIKTQLATHGGILWMQRDPTTGKFPVETLRPEPLNETFVFLVNYMAMTMEYGLQQGGLTMGDASQAPRTLGATMQIGEWAEEALILPRVEIERGIQKLYNLFFQWAPQVYTQFKVFSTYDTVADEEQTYAINEPAFDLGNSGEELTILRNMSNFRARWRIHAGSMAPSRSIEKANLFKELLQVTQNPAFLKPLIEHLPLSKNRAQLLQAVDLIPQLLQQAQQQNQQIAQLEGEVQRQESQNVEARKALKVERELQDFHSTITDKTNDLVNKGKDLDREIKNAKSAGSRSGTNDSQ